MPQQIRAAIETAFIVALMVLSLWIGVCVQGWHKDSQIATMKAGWEQTVKSAGEARDAAEKRAGQAEAKERQRYADALEKYKESVDHEKAISDRTIADLRAGNDRLRVSTARAAPGSCAVSGTPAGAAGSNEASEETLAPAVAARLAERYAAYNALVDQLTLCQETVRARSAPAP